MRKRIGLACAVVLTSLASLGAPAPMPRSIPFALKTAVYCPELPAECCRIGWSGGCKVCLQSGC
jgi:hypothetical protein